MEVIVVKQEKRLLEERLEKVISERNRDHYTEGNIKEKIKEHGFEITEVTKIWKSPKSIESISEVLLYLITKYLYEETGEESINPESFYTEAEIRDGNNAIHFKNDERISFPLVFEKVLKNRDDQYITVVPIQRIKQLIDNGLVTYNFNTQRNAKHKLDKKENLIKIPNTNPKSVAEITELIKNDDFIPNTISLNLLQDGNDKFTYDERSMELTMYSGQINPVDGWHRDKAIVAALLDAKKKGKTIELNMELRLTNWDEGRCKQFIDQEDHHNKINKRYIQSEIRSDKSNKVVARINQSDGDMKGKINTDIAVIRMNQAYTMTDLLSKTISLLWKFEATNDVYDLSNYLIEFFNHLIGHKRNDFIKNVEQSRKENVITYPVTFVGYLAIAHKIQEEKDWREKFNKFLDKTDFNINKQDWAEIGIIDKRNMNYATNLTNKKRYDKVIKYFEGLV